MLHIDYKKHVSIQFTEWLIACHSGSQSGHSDARGAGGGAVRCLLVGSYVCSDLTPRTTEHFVRGLTKRPFSDWTPPRRLCGAARRHNCGGGGNVSSPHDVTRDVTWIVELIGLRAVLRRGMVNRTASSPAGSGTKGSATCFTLGMRWGSCKVYSHQKLKSPRIWSAIFYWLKFI